jgi:DNA-binding CsgD family transcriptional regulator
MHLHAARFAPGPERDSPKRMPSSPALRSEPSNDELLSILEAIYRVEVSEDRWLSGIAESFRPLAPDTLGVSAYTYELSAEARLLFRGFAWQGDSSVDAHGVISMQMATPGPVISSVYQSSCILGSDSPNLLTAAPQRAYLEPRGISDIMGFNGRDATGVGCCVAIPLFQRHRLAPHERRAWNSVAAHLARAQRVRRRLAGARPNVGPARPAKSASPEALSPRERQVLSLAAAGDTNKVIAYELGLSPSTVGVLVSRAMRKLGAPTRLAAIRTFLDQRG